MLSTTPAVGVPGGLSEDLWNAVRSTRVNTLLVVGDVTTTVEALRIARAPVTIWRPGSPLLLPAVVETGTLIVQDVGALSREDQHSLCEWLEIMAGRTRVISTSVRPIFPMVEAGTFSPTLYYRLNMLYFNVNERH